MSPIVKGWLKRYSWLNFFSDPPQCKSPFKIWGTVKGNPQLGKSPTWRRRGFCNTLTASWALPVVEEPFDIYIKVIKTNIQEQIAGLIYLANNLFNPCCVLTKSKWDINSRLYLCNVWVWNRYFIKLPTPKYNHGVSKLHYLDADLKCSLS